MEKRKTLSSGLYIREGWRDVLSIYDQRNARGACNIKWCRDGRTEIAHHKDLLYPRSPEVHQRNRPDRGAV